MVSLEASFLARNLRQIVHHAPECQESVENIRQACLVRLKDRGPRTQRRMNPARGQDGLGVDTSGGCRSSLLSVTTSHCDRDLMT